MSRGCCDNTLRETIVRPSRLHYSGCICFGQVAALSNVMSWREVCLWRLAAEGKYSGLHETGWPDPATPRYPLVQVVHSLTRSNKICCAGSRDAPDDVAIKMPMLFVNDSRTAIPFLGGSEKLNTVQLLKRRGVEGTQVNWSRLHKSTNWPSRGRDSNDALLHVSDRFDRGNFDHLSAGVLLDGNEIPIRFFETMKDKQISRRALGDLEG